MLLSKKDHVFKSSFSEPGGVTGKAQVSLSRYLSRKADDCAFASKRLFLNPFRDEYKNIIVHGSHHKVGTVWFSGILRDIARKYGLYYQSCHQEDLNSKTDIFLQNHSRIDFSKLEPYRASHMVRDPRDVLVSSYFYHLWTKESWAHVPMRDLPEPMRLKWSLLPLDECGEMSYQQYLKSLNQEEGLVAETRRMAKTFIREVTDWDYDNPHCIEIKYEDLIHNEQSIFGKVFHHYGFNDEATSKSLEIVKDNSFSSKTGRKIGQLSCGSHLRSGQAGEWNKYFNSELKDYFKELCGHALIKMGYESNMNW